MTEARCSKCKTIRPVSEFYIQNKETGRINPWCKSCYKDWYRGRGGYTTSRIAQCEWCDSTFETPYPKTRFCSVAHKAAAASSRRRGGPSRKPDRSCVHCNAVLPRSMRADAKFCSQACSDAAHSVTRKMAKRIGRPGRGDSPLIGRNWIAQRDNYRCGICGGRVNMALRHPDPMCASIDHIVPLSARGTNDLPNLQLAHLRCNLAKGDRGDTQQLRLM